MEQFSELIKNETWGAVDESTSADAKYEKFAEIYSKHYDIAFAQNIIRRKSQRKYPKPWIMPWLEDACSRKNDAYHQKIKNPSPENNTKYNKLKLFTEKHVDLAKKKFYSEYVKEHQADSKRQWQMINFLINRNSKHVKIDKIRDCERNVATAPQEIAEKFNDYFANIAKKLKEKIPQSMSDATNFLSSSTLNSIYLQPTNSTEISEIIKTLKVKATADINIASIKQADKANSKFSETIANVINASLTEGSFPTAMKTAKTVPIHKGGSKIDIQNYRPISLLSAFSKIYEKVMYQRIYDFLSLNNILIESQFGFRKARSCEHALLTAQHEILSSLNKKQISVLLLIDFSKAFDMVDHEILLKNYITMGYVVSLMLG